MFVSAGIHVFKVCSCILDQTNERAMQGAECVSMGARLTQQCLPVTERHGAVRWEGKKREESKGQNERSSAGCPSGEPPC